MIVNVPEILEVVEKWTVCTKWVTVWTTSMIIRYVSARVSDEAIWQHSLDCDVLSNQPLHGFRKNNDDLIS